MPFKVGDVVLVRYAYIDDNNNKKSKVRPAIVYKIHQEKSCALIKITSVNRSDKISGHWIMKDSDTGKEMGLLLDSFINLEEIYWINNKNVLRIIGTYSAIEKDVEAIDNLKIKVKREIEPD